MDLCKLFFQAISIGFWSGPRTSLGRKQRRHAQGYTYRLCLCKGYRQLDVPTRRRLLYTCDTILDISRSNCLNICWQMISGTWRIPDQSKISRSSVKLQADCPSNIWILPNDEPLSLRGNARDALILGLSNSRLQYMRPCRTGFQWIKLFRMRSGPSSSMPVEKVWTRIIMV